MTASNTERLRQGSPHGPRRHARRGDRMAHDDGRAAEVGARRMTRKSYTLNEEFLMYQRARRPIQQARPASDDIDWPELIGSFVVAVLLTAAFVAVYFWAYAAELGS